MEKNNKRTLLQAFPKSLQKLVVQIVNQEDYNEEYLLVSMLSAVASAAGNAVQLCVKGEWTTCASLYIILVGSAGLGKSHPLDFAYSPIIQHDEKLRQKFLEALSLVDNGKRRGTPASTLSLARTLVSDFTPEALLQTHDSNPRGIAIYVDEIMGMFNSVNQYSKGQLIEQLLTAYSGKPLDVMRVSMERPIHIAHPCINIVGTAQTDRIKELFTKGFQQNGLLDRFLFTLPSDETLSLWNKKKGRKVFSPVSAQWEDILKKVMSLEYNAEKPCEHKLHFSVSARKEFYDWHDKGVRNISQGKIAEREQGRMMKTHLHVARIALCIQLLKWACDEGKLDNVDVSSIRSAIQISQYFEDCFKRINAHVRRECMSPHLKMFVKGLKPKFNTTEAVSLGEDMGMGRRNVMYNISKLLRMEVIKQIQRGKYEKTDDFKNI